MKKIDVNRCRWNSALHVVAHARWQRMRGRRPSMMYGGERNPKKALNLAVDELKVYEPVGGTYINVFARRIVQIANVTGTTATGIFRDIVVKVSPGDDTQKIVEQCLK